MNIERRPGDGPWFPFVDEVAYRKWASFVERHEAARRECWRLGHTTVLRICADCDRAVTP